MSRGLFALAAIGLILMAGCAAQEKPVTVQQARAKLNGLGPDQVRACMGAPPISRSEGTVTLWSYPAPGANGASISTALDPASADFDYAPLSGDPGPWGQGGNQVSRVLGVEHGPLAPASCVVNVVFDSARVRAVTYVDPKGQLMAQGPGCTSVISRCVAPP